MSTNQGSVNWERRNPGSRIEQVTDDGYDRLVSAKAPGYKLTVKSSLRTAAVVVVIVVTADKIPCRPNYR